MDNEPKSSNHHLENHNPLESALQNMMTFAEYAKTHHSTLYTYELSIGNKSLYYFGAKHVFDHESPMLGQIRTSFEEFQPDIVFIEGPIWDDEKVKKISAMPIKDVVASYGETGFTLRLAIDKNIPWHAPDPNMKEAFNYLPTQGFSKDEIFTWFLLQAARLYSKREHESSFEDYAKPYVDFIKSSTDWSIFDFSPNRALQLGEQILGRPINLKTLHSEMPNLHNPIPSKDRTLIGVIDAAWTDYRDQKIVTDIATELEDNDRIFLTYGASHAVMEEPALRKLFASEKNQWDDLRLTAS